MLCKSGVFLSAFKRKERDPCFFPDFRNVAGRWRGKFGIGEGKY